MIVPRLRSEARGGASSGSSGRHSGSGGISGSGKFHHSHHHHPNDADLKRALQYSYTSQAVRKWEKRWVTIHETSMRVHKWMPVPTTAPQLASQMAADTVATHETPTINSDQQESQVQTQESIPVLTQDTQMLVDEESTSQPSQA